MEAYNIKINKEFGEPSYTLVEESEEEEGNGIIFKEMDDVLFSIEVSFIKKSKTVLRTRSDNVLNFNGRHNEACSSVSMP